MKTFDVVVIGAGAAGMMCAIEAGKRGRRVALIEHAEKAGQKILISGGGRCNFTNIHASPEQYTSENPDFCRSALSRYTPQDFIQWVESHGIPFHEKKLGQLFCDRKSREIVDMLIQECEAAGVLFFMNHHVTMVSKSTTFLVRTDLESFTCTSLVIATGGLSIPKVGASDFGYRIARQFGLKVIETAPALDGFVFSDQDRRRFQELAGVSADTILTCGGVSFRENVLFTHSGLSGPAALQGSLYWRKGEPVLLNLLPDLSAENAVGWLLAQKQKSPSQKLVTALSEKLPRRMTQKLSEMLNLPTQSLSHISDSALAETVRQLQHWTLLPEKTFGYERAEVTRGGVSTEELSSKTMEARKAPGLFFIGEVVDVTGWLGGYNFQWAWASAHAAGQAV